MTLDQAMAKLESLGTEQVRKMNAKNGTGDNQFGVKMGDIRSLAKEIKLDHALGKQLWATGNWDARLLATQVMKPKELSEAEIDEIIRAIPYADSTMTSQLADWVMTNLVKPYPKKEELRLKWLSDRHPMVARAAWSLTCERISKDPDGLDIAAILDRIEKELAVTPTPAQWTMNFALGEIGIRFPEYRDRAIAIGEKVGAFRDYPTSKGCTSPYVPTWIDAMVSRTG